MSPISRLRMIAGPNGSGKSTIRGILPEAIQGIYINPDEIEKELKKSGQLDLRKFGVEATQEEIASFFENSFFFKSQKVSKAQAYLDLANGIIKINPANSNSYVASVLSDFIRNKLLEAGNSFTFETVMSSRDKIDFLKKAKEKGYRVYLYYIATDDPEINRSRIRNRVTLGGHNVPEDKIESRYFRSLEFLLDAIKVSNRSYIFDNSSDGKDKTWLAEITDGKTIEVKSDFVPNWFRKYVLDGSISN